MNTTPATDKQIGFINRLVAERVIEADTRTLVQTRITEGLDKATASAMITWLLEQPKAQTTSQPIPEPEPLTEGMYRTDDGRIYKVQVAVHGSGHLYAKELVQAGPDAIEDGFVFEYAPGAMRRLTIADRMTLEQAREFGALYGTCCVCGRTLTNEDSIEAGIGPVCATKF